MQYFKFYVMNFPFRTVKTLHSRFFSRFNQLKLFVFPIHLHFHTLFVIFLIIDLVIHLVYLAQQTILLY